MSDYYDAWSANKKKRSLGTSASSSRLRRQQQQQQQQPLTSTSGVASTTATITPTSPSPPPPTTSPTIASSTIATTPASIRAHHIVLPPTSISPTLPRHPTPATISFKTGPLGTISSHNKSNITSTASPRSKSVSAWRFSRTIFDSSLRSSSLDGPSSYVTDFDDVDGDDDDDDDDDDGEEADNACNAPSYLSHVSVIPRIQGPTAGTTSSLTSTTAAATPNIKNSLKWSGGTSIPRSIPPTQTKHKQDDQQQSLTIEQLDTPDERLASVYSPFPYTSLARSSPALSGEALLAPADHPQSTTTFNTRLYPQPILHHLTPLTDHHQGQSPLSLTTTSSASNRNQLQGRRPRPWSQVIWESPLLGEGSQSQQQQTQQNQPHIRDHSITVGGTRTDIAYPALRKDMFTPAPEKEKERVVSKSVRITVEGGVASTATTAGSTTYPRIPAQTAAVGECNTGMLPKRELSHGRKTMNRISLGSGFYASIEPISLSNATPSTPKTRRQLVRLPARPQSVLIPSTAHHFPGSGSSNQSGAVNLPNGTRLGAGLQPISTEEFKRRRHKSQQLDMKGDLQRAVPIPWRQLAPMGAQDNAKTFHGIGSAPAAPILSLKKGASQEDTFGGPTTTAMYPLNETPEPARLVPPTPRKPNFFAKPSPFYTHQQRSSLSQGQGLPRLNPSPPTSAPTSFTFSSSPSSSQQQRNSSHTPSWFLPALLESSSFLFKKPLPSLAASRSSPSSSSPNRATFGLQQSNSPFTAARILNNTNSLYTPDGTHASPSHLRSSRQQQQQQRHSYRHASLQTRKSLPVTGPTSSSSFSSTSSNHHGTSQQQQQHSRCNHPHHNKDHLTLETQFFIGPIPVFFSLIRVGWAPRRNQKHQHHNLYQRTFLSRGTRDPTPARRDCINWNPTDKRPILFLLLIILNTIADHKSSSRWSCGPYNLNHNSTTFLSEVTWVLEYFGESGTPTRRSRLASEAVAYQEVKICEDPARQSEAVGVGEVDPKDDSSNLQLCPDEYQSHGDWCGPSGVEGAPYMLTVGLSMCMFGLYAMTHLRSPISRLVGYSGKVIRTYGAFHFRMLWEFVIP
ncbi:MAG: hypothetical protein J3R72DRAFT_475176 [Linnemannia gamsii]|nr:MAG: hypothetical protein J3R72DRAFT_475176 [Linnemannia gamsii]